MTLEKKTAQAYVNRISRYLMMVAEWVIALFLVFGIGYLLVQMILEYGGYIRQGALFEFNALLGQALNLVIGLELTRMLVHHDPRMLVDVLMFATTRQAVLDHSTVLENLMAVIAVLLLFAAKKYMLSSGVEEKIRLFGWSRRKERNGAAECAEREEADTKNDGI